MNGDIDKKDDMLSSNSGTTDPEFHPIPHWNKCGAFGLLMLNS